MAKAKRPKESQVRKSATGRSRAVTSTKERSTSKKSRSATKKRKASLSASAMPAEKRRSSAGDAQALSEKATKIPSAEATEPKIAAASNVTTPDSDPMIVTLDRRHIPDRRSGLDRRQQNIPVPVERRQLERRAKVPRRRQIDPTTCERDYTPEEIEFMKALDEYKRSSGRMFPTCSEILEVLKKLGYEKRPQPPAETVKTAGQLSSEDSPSPATESPTSRDARSATSTVTPTAPNPVPPDATPNQTGTAALAAPLEGPGLSAASLGTEVSAPSA